MKTQRDQLIISRILSTLDSVDGAPMAETILQANVGLNMEPRLSLSEFDENLRFAESQRWIASVRSNLGNLKWAISEKGRLALKEL